MNDVRREAPERLRLLDQFTVGDLEAIRLILRGDSVIDWRHLELGAEDEIRDFLSAQEIRPGDMVDRARMEHVKGESIAYLRRQFDYPIPRPVERASVPELLQLASGRGHRAMCACTILKCMHIIHHLDGRELLFVLPMSDQEVFNIVEEKVYRVIGGMLAGGFPIIEFVGGRKNKDSLITKLLSKQETIAAQIFDKLRFRIVTRTREDIFPILQYLTTKLFPFNYVVPGQSINSVFSFRSYVEGTPLRPVLAQLQSHEAVGDDFTPSDNKFSAQEYRIIHFVVDMPVRLPKRFLERAPAASQALGNVIFVICEFQIVDRDTEAHNEIGEASHAKYKERQKKAVMRRLHLGGGPPAAPKVPVIESREPKEKLPSKPPPPSPGLGRSLSEGRSQAPPGPGRNEAARDVRRKK
jgi:uncharacterized protein (TIGR04552 family)